MSMSLTHSRFYRPTTGGRVAGVGIGLARYFGLPVLFVRILLAILILGGIGFPFYLLMWVIMPRYGLRASGLSPAMILFIGLLGSPLLIMFLIFAMGANPPGAFILAGAAIIGSVMVARSRREEAILLEEAEFRIEELRPEFEHEEQIDRPRVGGVCWYIGNKVGMRPELVRLILVLLFFPTFPFVPIAYLLGILFIPAEQRGHSYPDHPVEVSI